MPGKAKAACFLLAFKGGPLFKTNAFRLFNRIDYLAESLKYLYAMVAGAPLQA